MYTCKSCYITAIVLQVLVFCINCLQGFSSTEVRDKHFEYCKDNEAVRIDMPENCIIKFKDGSRQLKTPFILYADFESILKPLSGCNGDPKNSYTRQINKHIPSGFCVYSKFAHGEVEDPLKVYRGQDCVEVFCDYIENEVKRLYHMFPQKKMDPLTKREWEQYSKATTCHICLEEFSKEDKKKNYISIWPI